MKAVGLLLTLAVQCSLVPPQVGADKGAPLGGGATPLGSSNVTLAPQQPDEYIQPTPQMLAAEVIMGGVGGYFGHRIFNPTGETAHFREKVLSEISLEKNKFDVNEVSNTNQLQSLSGLVQEAEFRFNKLSQNLNFKLAQLQARVNEHLADTHFATRNKIVVTRLQVPNLKG